MDGLIARSLRVEEAPAPYLVAPLLTDHLDTFASAPEGFKRLRELVLNLAVRGKLVPQDPKDEPAKKLLERIRKERTGLSARREKAVDPIDDDEIPYALPSTWCWVRLPEICHDWGQKVPDGPFTYIDVGAIDNERGIIADATQQLDASNAPSRARKIVRPGTVLYSTVRPYLLNIAVVNRTYEPEPIASTAFAILHPLNGIDGMFLFHYLRSQPFIDFVASKMVGVAYPAINDSNFFSGLFPLPPAAEQSRIVAKVDELMALIDALEAKVGAGETARGKLLDALLAALADSPDATATAEAWTQLAPHFDLLLQTPADVDRLQQTLLQLAVKGRLVPQDPKDEPAAALLKRIRAEKERLIVEGKIRREKPLPSVEDEKQEFVLPDGWEWTRLGHVGETNIGLTYAPSNLAERGMPVLRSCNIRKGKIDLTELVRVTGEIRAAARVREGDLLICARNGSKALVGKTALISELPEEMAFGAFMAIFRSPINEYLLLFINSPLFRRMIDDVNTTTINQITQNNLKSTAFPLPPLPEQSRIVAAVASLTALCDRLRERLAARRALSAQLAAALTESALA